MEQIETITETEILQLSVEHNLTEKIVKLAILIVFEKEIVELVKTE